MGRQHPGRSGKADPAPPSDATLGQAEEDLLRIGLRLAILGAVVQTCVHGINHLVGGSAFLDANSEDNPIAWAHASMIVLAGFGAVLLSYSDRTRRMAALSLGVILVALSLDEAASVHEPLARVLVDRAGLPATWDSVVWPLVYLPLASAIVLLLRSCLSSAPPRLRRYVAAALLTLVVAVAIEVISAPVSTDRNDLHALAGAFEEAAEFVGWTMLATGLIVRALLAWAGMTTDRDRAVRRGE